MRLLPKSLFGRLTLVLLIGLTATVLVSAWVQMRDRSQIIYQAIHTDLIQRTVGIVRLMDALQPEERDRLLPLLSTPQTRIGLTPDPMDLPQADVQSTVAARLVHRQLHDLRRAADALGKDIRRPPIPETGPFEVAQTSRAFNIMQRRIKRYVEDRARILAAVSHDLKTPLTRIRLRADLLEDEELGNKIRSDLDDMQAMVDATLDFMQGTESREKTHPLDLMALLESMRDDANEAGDRVRLQGYIAIPYPGKPIALKRCIGNLVQNAVRYGGEAEIDVRDSDEMVTVTISDHGPGIGEENMEKVFEPFFRLESSRGRHSGGTGLGLGIARNIARAHGGDLVLENRPEGGLIAVLTMPR